MPAPRRAAPAPFGEHGTLSSPPHREQSTQKRQACVGRSLIRAGERSPNENKAPSANDESNGVPAARENVKSAPLNFSCRRPANKRRRRRRERDRSSGRRGNQLVNRDVSSRRFSVAAYRLFVRALVGIVPRAVSCRGRGSLRSLSSQLGHETSPERAPPYEHPAAPGQIEINSSIRRGRPSRTALGVMFFFSLPQRAQNHNNKSAVQKASRHPLTFQVEKASEKSNRQSPADALEGTAAPHRCPAPGADRRSRRGNKSSGHCRFLRAPLPYSSSRRRRRCRLETRMNEPHRSRPPRIRTRISI